VRSLNEITNSTVVLLIGYKRVDFIQNRLNELSNNISIPIFISIDGSDIDSETAMKNLIEEYIKSNPNAPIHYRIHNQNLGLSTHVTEAISHVLKDFDQVIIIEDDIVLSDTFIHNMLGGLALMQQNSQFAIVCGFSAFSGCVNLRNGIKWRESCYFSPWGWATNAKQWNNYRIRIPANFREELENSDSWTQLSNFRKALWTSRFTKVQSEHPLTWDYQVQYLLFKNNLKVLHSTKRISDNEGFNRNDSTNTQLRRPKWMGKIAVSGSLSAQKVAYGSKFYEVIDAITIAGDDRLFKIIRMFSTWKTNFKSNRIMNRL
jgi:hypothetical protein